MVSFDPKIPCTTYLQCKFSIYIFVIDRALCLYVCWMVNNNSLDLCCINVMINVKVQISQLLNQRVDKAKLTMNEGELEAYEQKELQDLTNRFGDRLGKVCLLVFEI